MRSLGIGAFVLCAVALVACAEDPASSSQDEPLTAVPRDPKDPKTDDGKETTDDPYADADENDGPEGPGAGPDDVPASGANATCDTAKDLGQIAGDGESATLSAQGACTTWFKIRANETSSWTAHPIVLDVTLVSPEDEKFDLFAHLDTDVDRTECSAVFAKSDTPTGRSDSLRLKWGDPGIGNFHDDSRTLMLEVKSKTGRCATKGTFSLVVSHTQNAQ